MGFAPASAGTSSSGDWSLGSRSAGGKDSGGGHSHHRNNAFTPPRNHGGGAGYSVAGVATASASVASRSGAILVPSSSSSSQANNVPRLRPMTGLARADNPRNTATASASSSTTVATTTTTLPRGSRIVESAGYYQSILQSKITDIVQEIQRMQYETEMANPQSKPRMALQKKHDDLLSMVQKLEGQLADCNLAREHLRLGSSPSDIKNSTARIIANNKEKEKEIDGVFYKRKKVEEDIASVEAELKRRHAVVEEEASNEVGVTGGSIDLVEEYRTLVKQLEAITVETEQQEDETVLLRHKLKMMMKSNEDGGNEDRGLDSSQRKNQKKLIESMKKQLNDVEEDIELALMTENEARDYLLGKIDSVQSNTKEHEEESMQLEADVESLQEMHKKLLFDKIQGGTVKAYNKLLQKDVKLKQYLQEELPMLKAKLEGERSQVESNIELLRNDIREKERMLEMELPSNEEMELMKDEMAFTGKHLDANQETMALLHQQKKKRMEQLAHINTLDEQIKSESQELDKQMVILKQGIDKYTKHTEMQDSANAIRECLHDMIEKYSRAIQLVSELEKSISRNKGNDDGSSEWKELHELTSTINLLEQDLLNKYQHAQLSESKASYGDLKSDCLRLVDKMNQRIIKKQPNSGVLLSNPRLMRS